MESTHNNRSRLNERETINILFVCTMNKWRSPTAEKIYTKHDLIHARSRGSSRKAVRPIRAADLKWADLIMVMESKHRQQLLSRFPAELKYTELHVLDIPDEYQFMDPELIQTIKDSVDPLLAKWCL